ncbi:MAG: LysR family transcriptional regulator, partial [Bradyrhizobium sp.]|nr:LysR family transcriptional regulator [Bradyrhizobium sp.]
RHACLRLRWSTSGEFEDWRIYQDEDKLDLVVPGFVVAGSIGPLIATAEPGVGLAHLPTFDAGRPRILHITRRGIPVSGEHVV